MCRLSLRYAWRFRRIHARRKAARHLNDLIWLSFISPMNTLGLKRRATTRIRNSRLVHMVEENSRRARTTEWCFPAWRNPPGAMTKSPRPGTSIVFMISSPITTHRPPCRRKSSKYGFCDSTRCFRLSNGRGAVRDRLLGANVKKPIEQYDMLRRFREFLQWRQGDCIILAEANVLPETDFKYFGADGDRMRMMFNFRSTSILFTPSPRQISDRWQLR